MCYARTKQYNIGSASEGTHGISVSVQSFVRGLYLVLDGLQNLVLLHSIQIVSDLFHLMYIQTGVFEN